MTRTAHENVGLASGAVSPAAIRSLSASDLAELFTQFNDLTDRLQKSHETLAARASRLEAELRETKTQLRRSRELAALGEMAAGIAHEVRNPLASIGLYAKMLETDLSDRPDQAAIATRIAIAVRAVDHIVSDVLSFAREVRVRRQAVDLESVCEGVVESCRARLEAADVRIESNLADAPALTGDVGLLQQAVSNLVRNACDALEESPVGRQRVIHLEWARRRVRDERGAATDMVALVVRDTGPGIPDDVVRRMFNPFFTTRAAGTGLGLAIVHRIVDAHGGRVMVSNSSDGGAVIELQLPESRAQDAPSRGSQRHAANGVAA